ncbi:exported protein of unknown function [Legionella fallonii LLAP-10]|uniref:Uncharacterized protein n=1 Tax=Legionella fallonii LLAP-10 TaxID=1212491 RepID=A0A098G5B5_9GAMM|nr:exported protein of unknown function [Legionella fallonii LLAP-10]
MGRAEYLSKALSLTLVSIFNQIPFAGEGWYPHKIITFLELPWLDHGISTLHY